MQWYLKVLKDYANFSGRARRKEYWMFTLFNTIIIVALCILMGITSGSDGQSVISMIFTGILVIYCLAILIPSIAVTVRRLHDSDRSGFWVFINFVPYVGGLAIIVLMCLNGTPGSNRFGEDPLASSNSKDLL